MSKIIQYKCSIMLEASDGVNSFFRHPKLSRYFFEGVDSAKEIISILKGGKNAETLFESYESSKVGKTINWVADKVDAIRDSESYIINLLQTAGITVNGSKTYDIQVKNSEFYKKVIFGGNLALGETYMKGWWECEELDVFFDKVLQAGLGDSINGPTDILLKVKARLKNLQTRVGSKEVIDEHYNIGNEVYEIFLDELMLYTSAYFEKGDESLEDAQKNKLDLIAEKLQLKPEMRVLDIGCGWGKAAKYIADTYRVEVIGITLSEEQHKYAKENYDVEYVDIQIMDYRDLGEGKYNKAFDVIYTIGMTEHIGHKNHDIFVEKVDNSLKDGGKFLRHTIGSNTSDVIVNQWIHKYIFKNGLAPSQMQMAKAVEASDMILEDAHNFGPDYDKTLMEWHKRFKENYHILQERNPEKYDESFYKMFEYYLLSCAGAFRARYIQLYQNVYSKKDKEKYTGVR